jgi:hypothetical protein
VVGATGVTGPTASGGGAGALTLISTLTASNSADLHWNSLTGFDRYMLVWEGIILASATSLHIQFGEAASFETANYAWSVGHNTSNATSTSDTGIETGTAGGVNTVQYDGTATIMDMTTTGKNTCAVLNSILTVSGGGAPSACQGGGIYYGDTNAKTDLRLIAVTGNITSGKATLYGMG